MRSKEPSDGIPRPSMSGSYCPAGRSRESPSVTNMSFEQQRKLLDLLVSTFLLFNFGSCDRIHETYYRAHSAFRR